MFCIVENQEEYMDSFVKGPDFQNDSEKYQFQYKQLVRILTLDGKISSEEYIIEIEKPDRKGLISLIQVNTNRKIKVNQRRVLLNSDSNDSFAVGSGDKYRTVCHEPDCTYFSDVSGADESFNCPKHGDSKLNWRNRPMTETLTEKPKKEPKPMAKKDKEAKPIVKKEKQTPIAVDFHALKTKFELWTKTSVQFDHEHVDVKAHVLLIEGKHPRKFCFNTYNGNLGKKSKPLPINEFTHDTEIDGKKPWYTIKDIEKTRTQLTKEGYEKQ